MDEVYTLWDDETGNVLTDGSLEDVTKFIYELGQANPNMDFGQIRIVLPSIDFGEKALAEWAKTHDWRVQANQEELVFFAAQARYARKGRDDDALSHWISEIIHALGIYAMTDTEIQGITDRHFANLIANVGDEGKAKADEAKL